MKKQQIATFSKIRIKKGDTVIVRSGKYKGKTGPVLSVQPKLNAVTVEGINIVQKHVKPSKANPQGGILEITKPINASKIGIYDPTAKKALRIGYQIAKDGTRTRVFKTSGKEIK